MSVHVVLFRYGDESDPYESALADAGFACDSIPVLRFDFVNEEALREALEHPRNYDGLILTSPRSVEALANAMSWLPTENVLWHTKSIFAVGPRTAAELRNIGFEPHGERSGSAAMLAEYLLHQNFSRPLLFLCGSRRRDTLPDLLRQDGVAFEELCVYTSDERADLDLGSRPPPDWVVFFSPRGVDAVIADGAWALETMYIAAIGETTSQAVRAAGYPVIAVAGEPTPDALADALLAADRQRASGDARP